MIPDGGPCGLGEAAAATPGLLKWLPRAMPSGCRENSKPVQLNDFFAPPFNSLSGQNVKGIADSLRPLQEFA